MTTVQASCFSKKGINSVRLSLRRIRAFPVSSTAWTWKTDLAVSRPIMVMDTADGSFLTGFTTPLWHTDALGPSTPSGGAGQDHSAGGRGIGVEETANELAIWRKTAST